MRENKQTKLSSIVKSLPGWRPHKTDQSRGLQYNNNKKTTESAKPAHESYL